MKYIKAEKQMLNNIYGLVQKTIKAVYPKYYPCEVVDFFFILQTILIKI